MSKPLNHRQEQFVKAVAAGASTKYAALAVGYSPSYAEVAGHRLVKNPDIKAAIESIKAEGRKMAAFDLSAAMAEAQDAADFARLNKNSMALVKAVALRCELAGLLVQQIHLKAEVVDIAEALRDARQRVTATVDAPVSLPLPSPVDVKPAEDAAPTSARPAWSPFSE